MSTPVVVTHCIGPCVGPSDLWYVALSLGVMTAVHGRFEPRYLRWSVPYAAWVAGWALLNYGGLMSFVYGHVTPWPVHPMLDPALWPVYAVGASLAGGPALGLAWRRRDLRLGEAAP